MHYHFASGFFYVSLWHSSSQHQPHPLKATGTYTRGNKTLLKICRHSSVYSFSFVIMKVCLPRERRKHNFICLSDRWIIDISVFRRGMWALFTLAQGSADGRHGLAEEGGRRGQSCQQWEPPPSVVQEAGLAGGTQPPGLQKGCCSCLRASGEIPYTGVECKGEKVQGVQETHEGRSKARVLRQRAKTSPCSFD